MNRSFLITRPHHDVLTNYLSAWSEDIKALAQSKGLMVYDLAGPKATRQVFESYAQTHKPSLLFLNGHGNATTIAGHENEPLVDSSTRLHATIIYARR